MDLEILWKAIVPLAFLAIWALTALFNRDAKPLPNRVQATNPYGPKPTPPPPSPRAPVPDRSPTLRWGPAAPPGVMPKAGGNDDDIVILDSPRQVPSRADAPRVVTPSRRARPKPVIAAKPAPPVEGRGGGLAGVSQSVNQQLTTSLSMAPLSETSPIATVQGSSVAPTSVEIDTGRIRALSVRAAMTEPNRLREAIMVNEILQPPLSLRKGARRR